MIHLFEGGFFNKWMKDEYDDIQRQLQYSRNQSDTSEQAKRAITLEGVAGPLYLLLTGYILAGDINSFFK